MRAGIYQLYRRTDHINHINVFPVPDGDTGTNMAMTMSAMLAALDKDNAQHAGNLLTRAADAALDGARGNSGAIIAQFFLGLAERTANNVELSLADFSAGVSAGAGNARLALTRPREGTILTVIADFATALAASLPAAGRDFKAAFAVVMPQVRTSLQRTPEQLEELRGANVVDAGAAGLVEWLEGFASWLRTGEVREVNSPVHGESELMAQGGELGAHRYCTECMVAGQSIDLRKVRETLNLLGSSLVVSGHPAKLRIHIHSNEPEAVFAAAGQFGAVSACKADDMLRQQSAAHHDRRRRVAVVTDSAADIPEAALENLDIHVVPVRVQFGAQSYLDKVTMSHDEFYRLLASSPDHPKTSQPPPGDFRRMFEFLASHYERVVSINLSGKVSGTWNAAFAAAERIGGAKVAVIDSRNVSLGQGLIAMAAAECAAAGGDGNAVAAAAQQALLTTDVYGLLARTDFAVRGGRVPRAVGKLAEWLRCCPVLANLPDGRVSVGTIIWSRKHALQRFADFLRSKLRVNERYRIAVGHGNAEQAGQELLRSICAGQQNIEAAYLTGVGPALGVHGGPGLLVVGIQKLPKPTAT